jgi:hypothetical protein
MSNADVLKDIIDASPGLSEAAQESMDATDEQIAILQTDQDALKFQLDSLKTDLESDVDSTATMYKFFTYDDYYTGSLLSIDDNIEEWQKFNRKSADVTFEAVDEFLIDDDAVQLIFTGSGLNDMSKNSTGYVLTEIVHYKIVIDGTGATDTFKWSDSGGIDWNETLVEITAGFDQTLNKNVTIQYAAGTGHTSSDQWEFWIIPIGSEIYFDGADQTDIRISGTVSTVNYVLTDTHVVMNMGVDEIPSDLTELLDYNLIPNGVGWPTGELEDYITEFDFANQFIHLPVGLSGTYGTKDMIAKLQLSKAMQQNNKDNADDTPAGLGRYAATE